MKTPTHTLAKPFTCGSGTYPIGTPCVVSPMFNDKDLLQVTLCIDSPVTISFVMVPRDEVQEIKILNK